MSALAIVVFGGLINLTLCLIAYRLSEIRDRMPIPPNEIKP